MKFVKFRGLEKNLAIRYTSIASKPMYSQSGSKSTSNLLLIIISRHGLWHTNFCHALCARIIVYDDLHALPKIPGYVPVDCSSPTYTVDCCKTYQP